MMSLLASMGIAILAGAVLGAILSILFIWMGTGVAKVVGATWGRVVLAALAATAVIWILTAAFSIVPACGLLGFLVGLGISWVIIKAVFGLSYPQALPVWLFSAGAQIVALMVAFAVFVGLGVLLKPARPTTLWLPLLPARPPAVALSPTPGPTTPAPTVERPTATPEQPTLTPTVEEPTATPERPTTTPVVQGVGTVAQKVNFRDGPGTEYSVLDQLDAGERLDLLARTGDAKWLKVRVQDEGTIGWVHADYVDTAIDVTALSVVPPEELPPKPPPQVFEIEYRGCIGGTPKNIGVVKGQVFDRRGRIIVGARVGIWIDGYWWDSPANPARTNEAGWYEWNLTVGQRVRFVSLTVGGRPVSFTPSGFEVRATGGCFQHVNFRER
ncbi:MAG: SH3 domain-containing protein [Anaerolineae bacterium]